MHIDRLRAVDIRLLMVCANSTVVSSRSKRCGTYANSNGTKALMSVFCIHTKTYNTFKTVVCKE